MNATITHRKPYKGKDVTLPDWLDPAPAFELVAGADASRVRAALTSDSPDVNDFAALISPAAEPFLEEMARRARTLTEHQFGRTISLYVPLYLADYCSSGCIYCGFSSDRTRPRRKLSAEDLEREIKALRDMGFDEILLLTGDRTTEADFRYLRDCVASAAASFSTVAVETFTLKADEYRGLVEAGCTSVALYQETYDPKAYYPLHRWGPKVHFERRLMGPELALSSGIRMMGLGVLLGLVDPVFDLLAVFRHAAYLRRKFWQSGVSVSFPRMRPQFGDYEPPHPVDDKAFAQYIFAFRICMPEIPLVLSTRESARFRDGIAGIGVSKMSVASRTTVGGYADEGGREYGQFDISDERDVDAFCAALRAGGLEPVFKNGDAAYRS